ncbi:MAG: Fe-S protein assembly co-chaperone HscB [Nitrospirae bacterium]|nr:Fe-S protein assembly co-chaperone HscB [Nitrospirota bacterium]
MISKELMHPDSRGHSHSVCWNCEKSLGDEDVCPSCVRVQPFGKERDYYSILGLPVRLTLDPRLLVAAYHEKSRTFHPDHHVGDSDKEQSITLANASLVNLAFRTLRDPFLRAHYFIGHLKGEPARPNRKASLPPSDLMEIMELREELDSLLSSQGPQSAEHRLRSVIDPIERDIFDSFDTIDRLVETSEKDAASLSRALATLSERLEKRSYLQNILKEIKEAS